MNKLDILKSMIDEENYPYFEEEYLESRIAQIDMLEDITIESIARELCLLKSGIEELKIGDFIIPSPRKHFLVLANKYRNNHTGVVIRIDGR